MKIKQSLKKLYYRLFTEDRFANRKTQRTQAKFDKTVGEVYEVDMRKSSDGAGYILTLGNKNRGTRED